MKNEPFIVGLAYIVEMRDLRMRVVILQNESAKC